MPLCNSESDAFVFEWRIENPCAWMKEKTGLVYALSPNFLVQVLEGTKWYCRFSENGVICVNRAFDDGPEEIEVAWRVSIFKLDGSLLSSDIQKHSFIKRGTHSVEFGDKFDWFTFVDHKNILRVRFLLWGNEPTSQVDFPPKKCCGVTRFNEELISFRLDSASLEALREKGAVSVAVGSASSARPLFNVTCLLREYSKHADIEIIRMERLEEEILLHCKISVGNMSGKIIHNVNYFCEFGVMQNNWNAESFVKKSYLFPDHSETHLRDDRFILFNIRASDVVDKTWIEETNYIENAPPHAPPLPSTLKQNLYDLYKAKQLCDFKLKMEDGTLEAHKTVLGAWSEVFLAMFTNDTLERITERVRIPDIDTATMKVFLHYLYTESVEDPGWQTCLKLYFAADKYQVQSLRNICSAYLKDHLTIENVCEVLLLTDRHQDGDLKDSAVDFLFVHKKSVFESEEWEVFSCDHLKLAYDILKMVCKM